MTPAEVVIDVFGGVRAAARAVNVEPSTVLRWCKRADGTLKIGWIPHEYIRPILDAAAQQGKRLTIEEVIWGRPHIGRRVVTFTLSSERAKPTALSIMAQSVTLRM